MSFLKQENEVVGSSSAALSAGGRGVQSAEDTVVLMKDIFPKNDVAALFGGNIVFDDFTIEDIDEIRNHVPRHLFETALFVWNRIIDLGLYPVDPAYAADFIRRRDPDLYSKVSKIIRNSVIRDICYVRGRVEAQPLAIVSEFFIAQVYPNNLFIADVEISGPKNSWNDAQKPEHSGAPEVLINKTIDNAVRYGRFKNCNYLLASAKMPFHVEIFARRGFLLEDDWVEMKSKFFGMGIPMMRKL